MCTFIVQPLNSEERWEIVREKLASHPERMLQIEGYLQEFDAALVQAQKQLTDNETLIQSTTPIGPDAELAQHDYVSIWTYNLYSSIPFFSSIVVPHHW